MGICKPKKKRLIKKQILIFRRSMLDIKSDTDTKKMHIVNKKTYGNKGIQQ